MDIVGTGQGTVGHIHLGQAWDQWRLVMNTVVNTGFHDVWKNSGPALKMGAAPWRYFSYAAVRYVTNELKWTGSKGGQLRDVVNQSTKSANISEHEF